MGATQVKTLGVLLTGVLIGLVSSCGVSYSGASTGQPGLTTVVRVDGYNLYRLCDSGRVVYMTSNGGVAVSDSVGC